MKSKILLCNVLILFALCAANGQSKRALGSFDVPHCVNLTTREGLVSPISQALAQDRQGYIWIGSNDGLTRYDGKNCKSFLHKSEDSTTLDANYFNDLEADAEGRVWCATIGGLDAYLPDRQQFKHYTKNISGTYVKCLLNENSDWIWVGTMNRDAHAGGGLNLLNKRTGEHGYWEITSEKANFSFKHNSVTALAKDKNNEHWLWVSTESGVALFDISQFRFINFWRVPAMDLAQYQYVTSILPQEDGSLWVGCWALGLYHFFPPKSTWEYVEVKPDVKDKFRIVTSIARKSATEIWVGTQYGIHFLDKKTLKPTLWEHDNRDAESVLGYLVWDILEDKSGIAWFALDSGVSRWDKRQDLFRFFRAEVHQKLNSNVYAITGIAEDTARRVFDMTVGSGENVYSIDYQNNTSDVTYFFSWKNKKQEPRFFDGITNDKYGRQWLMSQNEVFTRDKNKITLFEPSFLAGKIPKTMTVKSLQADEQGNIWAVGQDDFFYFNPDKKTFRYYNIKAYNLPNVKPNDFISRLLPDGKGNAYVTTSSGLIVAQGDFLKQYILFDNPESPLNTLRSVAFAEDGKLWLIAANQGVVKCEIKENHLEMEKNNTGSYFFLEGNIQDIIADNEKNIWAATAKGILFYNPKNRQLLTFDETHGLTKGKTPAVQGGRIFTKTASGKIFFPTNYNRLAWFRPSEIIVKTEPKPSVYFDGFKVFDKDLTAKKSLNFPDKVQLTYKENFFSIAYSAVHFSNAQNVKYAYRLDGIDANWITTQGGTANYTNIKGGNYAFHLKAKNTTGVWSEERVLNISVEPPFWEKWWFYLGIFLFLCACFYGFYKYRISQINEKSRIEKLAMQSEVKALRAQMNPHFMFNALNSVKSYVLGNQPLKASEYLSNFAYLLRQTLQQSREHTITLRGDLETVKLYVEMEQMRFQETFSVVYEIAEDVDLEQVMIPPMLSQPYIENAIKHGLPARKKEGLLTISVQYADEKQEEILYCIEDNGVGRKTTSAEKNPQHKSLGMVIIQERIDIHNQLNNNKLDVKIIDKKDENGVAIGTKVVLKLTLS